MLTHRNILANIDADAQVFQADAGRRDGRRAAVLSLLRLHRHAVAAAGRRLRRASTIPTRWTPRRSASIAAKYRGTILISTPTFYRSYLRKCEPESSRTLRYAIVGAEKLRAPVARRVPGAVRRRRCSRATAARRWRRSSRSTCRSRGRQADRRHGRHRGIRCRRRRRPGDRRRAARSARKGCCWSTGPNVMHGYLGDPALTADGPPRRLVRRPATSRRSTTTASSASPTGCRGSARSPARWCRT